MKIILDLAWMLSSVLKFGGLALALGGVAMFGWYFVRANARAARNDVGANAAVAWGGADAMKGVKLLALGLAVQVAAFVLILLLPGRP